MTIELVTALTATSEQAELLRRTPPINLFGLLAHAPALGARIAALGARVMEGDPVLRELVAIRVGRRLGGGYVMMQHRRAARLFGVDPVLIAAAAGEALPGISALHRDVLALADAVAKANPLDEPLIARMEAAVGGEALVGLVVSAAYFAMLAGITAAFSLPLEGVTGLGDAKPEG